MFDEMSESEALQDWEDAYQADEDAAIEEAEAACSRKVRDKASVMARRDAAIAAGVGTSVTCPWCEKTFIKLTSYHTFCSNGRTRKNGSSCKDKYWNFVRG